MLTASWCSSSTCWSSAESSCSSWWCSRSTTSVPQRPGSASRRRDLSTCRPGFRPSPWCCPCSSCSCCGPRAADRGRCRCRPRRPRRASWRPRDRPTASACRTATVPAFGITLVAAHVGAVISIWAARTRHRIVVSVVTRRNVNADPVERGVRGVLDRCREHIGRRGEPDAPEHEPTDRRRHEHLRSEAAGAGSSIGADAVEASSREPGTHRCVTERPQAPGHIVVSSPGIISFSSMQCYRLSGRSGYGSADRRRANAAHYDFESRRLLCPWAVLPMAPPALSQYASVLAGGAQRPYRGLQGGHTEC